MIKENLEKAADAMVFVQSDISSVHSELCESSPMAAVAVRDLMADVASLQIRINELTALAGE